MAPSERFDKSALAARQALRTYGAHILSLSRSALVRCEEMLLLSSSSKDEALPSASNAHAVSIKRLHS